MKVREASGDDVSAIAEIHVRSWQAAYQGILPNELLKTASRSPSAKKAGKRSFATAGSIG